MPKRTSLREFQRSLAERLGSAQRGERSSALLGIESGSAELPGGSHWLIDLADSGEVVPLTTLAPVPLTRPWFAGIANIRGALYSVIDFSAWRGGAPTPRGPDARLVLVGARHGINSALLVARTLGLRAPATLQAVDSATATSEWQGGRFGDPQDTVWTQLRVQGLLADPDFLNIVI